MPIQLLLAFFVLLLNSCAALTSRECSLQPLADEEVIAIANAYLEGKKLNPEFHAKAQRRVRSLGCRYEYEEAEKLDSFGVSITVLIDRRKRVIDFSGSE